MNKDSLLYRILFYDIKNIVPKPKSNNHILEWLNSRKPLSVRIKEFNQSTL